MKISKLLLTTSILALPFAANATDAGKSYVSLTGEYIFSAEADASVAGVDAGSVDYDDSSGALIAVGYNVDDNIRVEGEFGYRELNINAGTTGIDDPKATSLMANGYYKLPVDSVVSPYVGAGIGWVHESEIDGDAFGYQAMVGVDYKLPEDGAIFGGYRYLGTTDFEDTTAGVNQEISIDAHIIDIGYRMSF